jgi:hypothetical protein
MLSAQEERSMAKARAGRAKGRRATVGKGQLEVGNARRESGAAAVSQSATRRAPSGKAAAQLPGEKAVKRTGATVPVKPERDTRAKSEPTPPAALDRRRQGVGTDEPPAPAKRRR